MKKQKSNPIAAIGAVTTLVIIGISVRLCMRRYGR